VPFDSQSLSYSFALAVTRDFWALQDPAHRLKQSKGRMQKPTQVNQQTGNGDRERA